MSANQTPAIKAAVALLSYQIKSILDRPRFKCLFWARGARKSFTVTLEIVDCIFQAEAEGRREEWNIISRGERQAKIEMAEIKKHFAAYNTGIRETLDDEATWAWSEFDNKYVKVLEVTTPNGSIVRALPANPDTIRGYTCNIYLAEFGVFPPAQSEEIWKAAYPCLRGRLRMIVASTGKGKGNKFYQIATNNSGVWSIHKVDIYQAVEAGLPFDIELERQALNDEDAWAQEYELKWLDEASAWLSFDLICAVEHEQAGKPELYEGNPVYIGNDIGLRSHLWVTWIAEPIGDVLWTREIITHQRISFAKQDLIMDGVFDRYNVGRLCMDQTGMGEKPVEDAQRRYGQHRVEGVLFSLASKLFMATLLKQRFESKRIRNPVDTKLRLDLHKLRKVPSPTSDTPRFAADADSNGHADRTWACGLMLNAAESPPVEIDYQSTGHRVVAHDADVFTGSRRIDLGGF